MLRALIVSNDKPGLAEAYRDTSDIGYRIHEVTPGRALDLDAIDLLVVPNGSDQVDLALNRRAIEGFLGRGGIVFCFDGFFTGWIPGSRWIMDNHLRRGALEYRRRSDRHGLLDGVEVEALLAAHGIRGWWANGYIVPAPGAETLLDDPWGRAIVVLDEVTTPGAIFMTCGGPCADHTTATGDPASRAAVAALYRNALAYAMARP